MAHSRRRNRIKALKSRRESLWKRSGGICHYCFRLTVLAKSPEAAENLDEMATVDHKHPRSLGGENDPSNYVLACHKCNNGKGEMEYEAYINNISGKLDYPSSKPPEERPPIYGIGSLEFQDHSRRGRLY